MADSVTAVDYLEQQLSLERQAREIMPYEPDCCTYPRLLRQLVFACLTCRRHNNGANVAVCYLCLIQCHSTHELVELFSKRNVACDCGTTRMGNGAGCRLRANAPGNDDSGSGSRVPRLRTGSSSLLEPVHVSSLDLKAEDIPVLDNVYNQNYRGRFCLCHVLYDPEKETGTMHQCYLGNVCGEDWFHQECIMGVKKEEKKEENGENEENEEKEIGNEIKEDNKKNIKVENEKNAVKTETSDLVKTETTSDLVKDQTSNRISVDPTETESSDAPFFPSLDSFSEFVCWQCVQSHKEAFKQLAQHANIVAHKLPHVLVDSALEWKKHYDAFVSDEPPLKKRPNQETPFSVMLAPDFKEELTQLKNSLDDKSPLARLLQEYPFLYGEDPTYEPENDTDSVSSGASLFELGSNALLSLPAPQAIEGLHAYGKMKEKLRDFFKTFVDQKKVVTEEEVREFFGNMDK